MERGPDAWGQYEYVRVAGICMAPSIREGSWVGVDASRTPTLGDVVVARNGQAVMVAALAEWLGQRWLVTVQCPPKPLDEQTEIVGVVALIVQAL